MHEYTPLDLKSFHNAGLALLTEQGTALIGPQQFRGLPFLIGTDPQGCFIAFGDGWQNAPLNIPIAERAQSVSLSPTMSSPIRTGTKSASPFATASKSPKSRPPGDNSPSAPSPTRATSCLRETPDALTRAESAKQR
jgi:hypothetical protein